MSKLHSLHGLLQECSEHSKTFSELDTGDRRVKCSHELWPLDHRSGQFNISNVDLIFLKNAYLKGARGSLVVKALGYKPERPDEVKF
jgi:hypothetical protein